MISIIISQYSALQVDSLKKNIQSTIGVPFELIVIDNSRGLMGLCQVYNIGASRARFELLCFSHEDVELATVNWGSKVIDLFNANEKLGLLGVAGSGFKSLSPSGWWYPYANTQTVFTNYIQSDPHRKEGELQCSNPRNNTVANVVCVDGFWFCTRKAIALQIKFDEDTFKGFHCYDIDFSLAVFRQYEVGVSFEILIKHFSGGHLSRQWVNDTLMLYKKWEHALPLNVVGLDHKTVINEEIKALDYFQQVSLEHDIPLKQSFFLLWSGKIKQLVGFKIHVRQNLKLARTAMKAL
ncbi:MAG: glycosyltransferase [Chitinophagaceae bacterium]